MSNHFSNTNANTNTGNNYEEVDAAVVLSSQLPLQQEDVYAYTKNTATGTLLCWFSHGLSLLSALRSRFKKNKKNKNPATSTDTSEETASSQHHGHPHHGVAVAGFSALLWVTVATSLLGPMRDAAALSIGVSALPNLTLASTFLALGSSVPVGWLFEAPDPTLKRRLVFRRMGFTRGETQGTSLALFYRVFAAVLLSYGFLFLFVNHVHKSANVVFFLVVHLMKLHSISLMWGVVGQALDFEEQAVKLHQRKADAIHTLNIQRGKQQLTATNASSSQQEGYHTDSSLDDDNYNNHSTQQSSRRSRARIGRLAFVGFGGTLGGIIGSFIASSTAHLLRISGLLFLSALILIFSANLSIELGTIMKRHWEEQSIVRNWEEFMHDTAISSSISNTSTTSSSIRPSVSLGCMKRLATIGNDLSRLGDTTNTVTSTTTTSTKPIDDSIEQFNTSLGTMKRIASNNSLAQNQPLENQQFTTSLSSNMSSSTKNAAASMKRARSMTALKDSLSPQQQQQQVSTTSKAEVAINENAFSQRLLRGVNTIVRSRLLMAIFTYNALYASTTVLLSFQRAELVANRKSYSPTSHKNQHQKNSSIMHAEADTAFLAKINAVSNIAVFALQACGLGALLAHKCGQRGTLVLMPLCRLCGVLLLLWWHYFGQGQPPDLTLFLILDELTRVINFAVAKPVREGLWRGLSNEARYEAKPIVDTLANRWGSGSAAFLVSLMDRILAFIAWGFAFWNTGERATGVGIIRDEGQQQQHHHHNAVDTLSKKSVFGFPPLLILCLIISTWWVMVSLHLGRTRSRIDLELKKHL